MQQAVQDTITVPAPANTPGGVHFGVVPCTTTPSQHVRTLDYERQQLQQQQQQQLARSASSDVSSVEEDEQSVSATSPPDDLRHSTAAHPPTPAPTATSSSSFAPQTTNDAAPQNEAAAAASTDSNTTNIGPNTEQAGNTPFHAARDISPAVDDASAAAGGSARSSPTRQVVVHTRAGSGKQRESKQAGGSTGNTPPSELKRRKQSQSDSDSSRTKAAKAASAALAETGDISRHSTLVNRSVIITCIVLILAGIGICLFLYYYLHNQELKTWRSTMQLQCQSRLLAFQYFIGFSIDTLQTVAGFGVTTERIQAEGDPALTQDDFTAYSKFVGVQDWFEQVVYAPHLTNITRPIWEKQVGYNVTTYIFRNGTLGTLPFPYIYSDYFPWQFFVPYIPAYKIDIGFDTRVVPATMDYIRAATAAAGVYMSDRSVLDTVDGVPQYGIVVTLPLFPDATENVHAFNSSGISANGPPPPPDQRWSQLLGVVFASIKVGDLLARAIMSVSPVDMQVDLYDASAFQNASYIASYNQYNPNDTSILAYGETYNISFVMGLRDYTFVCTPTHEYVDSGYSSVPTIIAVLAGCVIALNVIFIISASLFFAARRTMHRNALLLQTNQAKTESLRILKETQLLTEGHNQSKSDFLSFLCHELRNPLHAVGSMVDFLLHSDHLLRHIDDDDAGHLQTIEDQVKLMNSIVNDALDLSKIEAGKMQMECVAFNLQKLCLSLISGYKTKALAQGIALRVHISPYVPHTLYSDPTRIRQVLSNLLSNALKFTTVGSVSLFVEVLPTNGSGGDTDSMAQWDANNILRVLNDANAQSRNNGGGANGGGNDKTNARAAVASPAATFNELEFDGTKGIRATALPTLPQAAAMSASTSSSIVLSGSNSAASVTHGTPPQSATTLTTNKDAPRTGEEGAAASTEATQQRSHLPAAPPLEPARTSTHTGASRRAGSSASSSAVGPTPGLVSILKGSPHGKIPPTQASQITDGDVADDEKQAFNESSRSASTSHSHSHSRTHRHQPASAGGGDFHITPATTSPGSATADTGTGHQQIELQLKALPNGGKLTRSAIAAAGAAAIHQHNVATGDSEEHSIHDSRSSRSSYEQHSSNSTQKDTEPDRTTTTTSARGIPTCLVRFHVVDSGCGISEAALQQLFQPYFQAKLSVARTHGGTGLGLSIVRQIVELLGGSIHVSSSVGVGTKMSFTLPLQLQRSNRTGAKSDSRSTALGGRPKGGRRIGGDNGDSRAASEERSTSMTPYPKRRVLSRPSHSVDAATVPEGDQDTLTIYGPKFHEEHTDNEGSHNDRKSFHGTIDTTKGEEQPGSSTSASASGGVGILRSCSDNNVPAASAPAATTQESTSPASAAEISLPLPSPPAPLTSAHVAPASAPASTEASASSPVAGPHVLVVDDSPINLRILCRMLETEGCTCVTARDGQEAYDIIVKKYQQWKVKHGNDNTAASSSSVSSSPTDAPQFSVVLSDVLMPVLDGLSACRLIRSFETKEKLSHIPIYAVSANALIQDKTSCFEAGFTGHLAKPFNRKQIKKIIESATQWNVTKHHHHHHGADTADREKHVRANLPATFEEFTS